MKTHIGSLRSSFVTCALFSAALFSSFNLAGKSLTHPGALFLATNNASKNEILMYNRAESGKLSLVGRYPTGGRGEGGTNDPLQSQSSVIVSPDHSFLFAVNAGTSDISTFRITDYGLILASVVPSGGGNPVSLTLHNDLLYALNFGGNLHTAGFRVHASGALKPVSGSRLPLSGLDPNASTVAFSPDGSKLVVTERNTNMVDVFSVNSDGSLSNPVFNASQGIEPFGMQFSPDGTLLVSETGGGPLIGGSVSSYKVNQDNTLTVITAKANAGGGATCWVVSNGAYAWASNTTSSSVGAYSISAGALSPLGPVATLPGPSAAPFGTSFPLDLGLSGDNQYLYVFFSTLGQVAGYKIDGTGHLTMVTLDNAETGQTGAAGLAVY